MIVRQPDSADGVFGDDIVLCEQDGHVDRLAQEFILFFKIGVTEHRGNAWVALGENFIEPGHKGALGQRPAEALSNCGE